LLLTRGPSRRVVLATGLVATTGAVTAETGKTARIAGGDSKGFGNPSKAAAVGSKTLTGSWLVAGSVSVFKLVGSEGPDDESSKFGVGERRRFLFFLTTLLGEEVPKSFGADSAELKSLAAFLLFCNLNAAYISKKEVQISKYRYCGRSTGEVGTTSWTWEGECYIKVVN
jgi:hypothetical protein